LQRRESAGQFFWCCHKGVRDKIESTNFDDKELEMQLDVNKGIRACEQVLARQSNVLHQRNLKLVIDHMRAEARCDVRGVLDTLVERPKYIWHGQPHDALLNPRGSKQAIADFYQRMIVEPQAYRLEWDITRVMVDESAVLTEGVMKVAFPGHALQAMDIEIDDAQAWYVAQGMTTVVWPVDPLEEKLIGEEVYDYDKMVGIADRKIAFDDILPLQAAAV